ncbi:hypothetical protein E3N88_46190 [Mikania micrantha]|uniref:Cytochrome P450 n=1 Tax=Mikania micrantha TaxID=192012 RepID=A0A5N6L9D5_9ASTR|nr:hypothetical protein E3N88_46190 [Mikania micrantha]
MKEIDKEVKILIKEIINKRVKAKENGESPKEDLLGLLLDSNDKEIRKQGNTNLGLALTKSLKTANSSTLQDKKLQQICLLYPPIAALGRMIHEETKIENLILPSGSHLMLHLMLLHYDANLWGDDANEFNPERFDEGVSKATKGQAIYFPFGGGPRICVGQAFAMLEAKLALVMILRHFSFKLSPSYSHAPHTIITLQPQFGAQLILSEL